MRVDYINQKINLAIINKIDKFERIEKLIILNRAILKALRVFTVIRTQPNRSSYTKWFDKVQGKLRRPKDGMRKVADVVRFMQEKLLETSGKSYGKPFKPLSASYASYKGRLLKKVHRLPFSSQFGSSPPILVLTGSMAQSLIKKRNPRHIEIIKQSGTAGIVRASLEFGTSHPLAHKHAKQGIMRPASGKRVRRNPLVSLTKTDTRDQILTALEQWTTGIQENAEETWPKITT